MTMLQLDGQSGGGQILRTALSLSMITGQPFRMTNIRGKRPKPGLMRQHLTCVKAAAEISNATTDGADLNSTELIFHPEEIISGSYHFKIGTAGSTSLLAQTLLPALWMAAENSQITLEGGTHNPMAPTSDFLDRAFLPAVAKLGFPATLQLIRHGFAPAGGGEIRLSVSPSTDRTPYHWTERGPFISRSVHSTIAHVPEEVAHRENNAALASLSWPADTETTVTHAQESTGSGNCFAAELTFENVTEHITSFGSFQRSAENVARETAKKMKNYTNSRAVIGRQLADQLLLPIVLAGSGSYVTTTPSNHTLTNIAVIEQFLDITFSVQQADTHTVISLS